VDKETVDFTHVAWGGRNRKEKKRVEITESALRDIWAGRAGAWWENVGTQLKGAIQ